uniref:Meiosis specific with coiled-coil domain n=2 Tax=Anabas testudineus TaxID=64144 RepID=A0AAQ6IJ59_ANATE
MHRENTPMNISQYSKHHIQQGQIQSKIKSQLQKDKTVMHMPVFLGDGLMARPLTNNYTREGEKKQALTQNPYFDLQGSMQSQKLDRGKHIVSVGNSQQFMPFMCTGNDPSRPSSNPINSNFSSRGTLPYGSGVPGMDVVDMVSANDSTVFNSYVGDMMTHRGDTTYQGMASAVTIPMVMNQGGPVIQLYFFLDECYEQWRCLEKERKRTEVILTKTFAGKRTTAVTNTTQPKTPPNPTRVDHLIVRQLREQAKVASLLDRMECLCNSPLHMNIHTALNRHHMAICITQSRRKEEIANMSKQQEQRAHFSEDRDTLLLVLALKDLAATTRKVRTALWCALQNTLPKPVKRQVHHVEEATCSERCSSPFEGYSFKL